MRSILYFFITAGLIYLAATYGGNFLGIQITGENTFISALIFSVILSAVNLFLGTIVRIITFPINLITFGIFSGLITLFLIWVTDKFYDNIALQNILGYIIIAIIPTLSKNILKK